jgi:hypothetical protein
MCESYFLRKTCIVCVCKKFMYVCVQTVCEFKKCVRRVHTKSVYYCKCVCLWAWGGACVQEKYLCLLDCVKIVCMCESKRLECMGGWVKIVCA